MYSYFIALKSCNSGAGEIGSYAVASAIMLLMSTLDKFVWWGICILLFCTGAFFVYVNFAVIYIAYFKKKHVSPTGLIGGVLCAFAILICPDKAVLSWFWVPLVLDPGCLLLVCEFIFVVVFQGALKGAFKR